MGWWEWIVVYVLLFAVLQLLVYRYLRDDDEPSVARSTPPRTDPTLDDRALDDLPGDDPAREERFSDDRTRHGDFDADADTRRCPQCGAENDPTYTFCRHCVNPIAPR